MGRRRIRSPLPTTPPIRSSPGDDDYKVCIAFWCVGMDAHEKVNIHYKLCFVDLKSDDLVGFDHDSPAAPIIPTLEIDTGASETTVFHAFCFCNHTLYVFEGCDRGRCTDVATHQKSIFTYDLRNSNSEKTTIYLHERDVNNNDSSILLTKVGDMFHKKVEPSAVPTPDGNKILLLDTQIDTGDVFELFDLATQSSEELPPIPISAGDNLYVSSHGFISMSEFVVEVLPVGNYFVIDLEHKEIGWKLVPGHDFRRGKRVFSVVEDRFLFSPCAVQDILSDLNHYFPISSFEGQDEIEHLSDLTLLKHDKDKGKSVFCVLHSESREHPSPSCKLSIDVCCAVYPKNGEEGDQEKPVEVVSNSSRRLTLSVDYDLVMIRPCSLLCI